MIRCLVDMGATVSLISREKVKSALVRKCGLEARGISGEKLRVNGLADLWFKIGDKIGLHSFVVVEMRDKCIIGADLLRKTGMVVDVAREKLLWEMGEMDLVVQENAPAVNKV